MALVATKLSPETLILSAPTAGEIQIPRHATPDSPLRVVSVWGSEGLLAEDCGDATADWLGSFLTVKCRLVRVGAKFHRPVQPHGTIHPDDRVAFNDSCPALIIGEASLANLNDRLQAAGEEPVPMDRFRPNLIVAGSAPFAEDAWHRIRAGHALFRDDGPCARCVITTTDQETAERAKEPLRMLASFRRDKANPSNVNFGQNFIHETKTGSVRVGDAVEVLECR
jgi:uncharacterized protein YcbX